jgi:hypothetical protein
MILKINKGLYLVGQYKINKSGQFFFNYGLIFQYYISIVKISGQYILVSIVWSVYKSFGL